MDHSLNFLTFTFAVLIGLVTLSFYMLRVMFRLVFAMFGSFGYFGVGFLAGAAHGIKKWKF